MDRSAVSILKNEKDIRLNFAGEFDGLQTVETVYDLIPPAGSVDRIAFDFSHASRVRPIEIYYLLAELSTEPRFTTTKISVEGLQCQHRNKRC